MPAASTCPEDMGNWTWNVPWFSDPVFLGQYPAEGLKKYAAYLPKITQQDMALISQPLDFMGENIYNGIMLEADENGEPRYVDRPSGFPTTGNGWPVTPECFRWGLKFLYERYKMPIFVTENGICSKDVISSDGRIHDPQRIDFLNRYILAMHQAMEEGADIRGYFQWTLTDNFEWDRGYQDRFGLVYVDFATQRRYRKDSSFWYEQVIRTQGANLLPDQALTVSSPDAIPEGERICVDGQKVLCGGTVTVIDGYGTLGAMVLRPGDQVRLPEQEHLLIGQLTIIYAQ